MKTTPRTENDRRPALKVRTAVKAGSTDSVADFLVRSRVRTFGADYATGNYDL